MEKAKAIPVVCAVIIRDGRVLLAQRPAGKHLALKWEFPGGKVEPGEEPAAALVREIEEELGCRIEVCERLPAVTHRYERGEVELIPFLCAISAGSAQPRPHEHMAVEWPLVSELRHYDLAAADLPIVSLLEERCV